MWVSKITEDDLTLEIIDRLLFQGLEDTGENIDCIIVLGSIKATKYRVPVAVNAYNAGRANKIMLCGGALREFPEGESSEAEHMRRRVLELGVAEDNNTNRNDWMNTPTGIERVKGEALNIVKCVKNGVIPDFEI